MNILFAGLGLDPNFKTDAAFTFIDMSAGERNNSPVLLVDMDGTLSDDSHRRHHVEEFKNWELYFAGAKKDRVNLNVLENIKRFWNEGARIIIVTGRHDRMAIDTLRWLHHADALQYVDSLFFKHGGSYAKNVDFKQSVIQFLVEQGDAFLGIIDDNDEVLKMAKELNLTAQHPDDLGKPQIIV